MITIDSGMEAGYNGRPTWVLVWALARVHELCTVQADMPCTSMALAIEAYPVVRAYVERLADRWEVENVPWTPRQG